MKGALVQAPHLETGLELQREGIAAIERVASLFAQDDWVAQSGCAGWTALDLAGHVLTVADLWHQLVDRFEAGATDPPFPFDRFDSINAEALAALPAGSGPERISVFASRAYAWVDRVAELDPERPFGAPGQTIATVPLTVRLFVRGAATEWHAHAWDLGVAIGEQYVPKRAADLYAGFRAWIPALPEEPRDAWKMFLSLSGRARS